MTAPDERRRAVRSRLLVAGVGLAGVVLLVAGAQAVALQAVRVASESMRPTLEVDDRVVVERLTLHRRAAERGEVVGVPRPGHGVRLQRVVGLPGEIVEVREGVVFVDGEPLSEPYAELEGRDLPPVDVPAGHYGLLGDNRAAAAAGRAGGGGVGVVPGERLVGRAVTVLWPPSRVTQELHAEPEPAVRAQRRLPR